MGGAPAAERDAAEAVAGAQFAARHAQGGGVWAAPRMAG